MLEGDGHIVDAAYIDLYNYLNSKIDEHSFDMECIKLLKLNKYSKEIEPYLFNNNTIKSFET